MTDALHLHALDWGILGPALVAGLLVLATHVPLGIQVLRKGIVEIDVEDLRFHPGCLKTEETASGPGPTSGAFQPLRSFLAYQTAASPISASRSKDNSPTVPGKTSKRSFSTEPRALPANKCAVTRSID